MKQTITEEYRQLLHQMHFDRGHFNGGTLTKYLADIQNYITEHDITTILDYGCGKGRAIPEQWNQVRLYDPGYQPFANKPTKTYDLVISTDVLEHVEEQYVDNVLEEIYGYADKAVYLAISTIKAKKTLPDGRNAHITIRSDKWWLECIKKAATRPTRVRFGLATWQI